MKPGDETPQNWQQPTESLPQAPYQVPTEPQPATAPVAPLPLEPIAQPAPVAQTSPIAPGAPLEPLAPSLQSLDTEQSTLDPLDGREADELSDLDEEAGDPSDDAALLRWQATEYIHHDRTSVWYVALAVVVVVFITLAIVVFHSVTFAILIPVMLVALVVYVRRPPSILNYTLSRKGLHVNDHLYIYDQFKAFGVVTHEDTHSAVLLPRKRFQVSQTIYFPEEVGEPLVDMLAQRLPMQEVKLDAVDRLLKKLRI